jgi:tetratricopeptide (TPR) repeat protein
MRPAHKAGRLLFPGTDSVTSFHLPFLPPEALGDEGSIATAALRAVALARGGETRAALNLARHARRRAQGMETAAGELEALNAAAVVHLIRGDTIGAVAAALDAFQLARRNPNRSLYGHALVSLKMAAYNLGACDDAVDTLDRCAREAAELRDVPLEIRARVGLGVVLGDAGRFDAAAREYARALPLAERHPAASPARVLANIANLHRKRGEAAEAIACAQAARRLSVGEVNVSVEIDALAIEGCCEQLRGATDRARALLRASARLGHASRCPTAVVWVQCEIGRLGLAAGDLEEARAAYGEVVAIAAELRPSRKIAVACEGLAEAEARSGNARHAREWRERAADETSQFEVARLQTHRQLMEVLAPGY